MSQMKRSWMILGALVLLIVCVAVLVYLFVQGLVTSLSWYLLVLLLVFGALALVGAIVWLAGWLPRKKGPEPAAMEEIKPKPRHLTEEEIARARRLAKGKVDRGSQVIDIEGIGPVYEGKLNAVNIYTTSDLLETCATSSERKELAEKIGISDKLILKWVNIADLFRIKGVGEEYSDLLEEAGVDTIVELAKRVPENLHAKMLEENEKKKLTRRPPTLEEVKRWIEEAKTLPRRVEY